MTSNQGRFAGLALGLVFFLSLWPTLNSTRLAEVDELIYARVAQDAARLGHWAPLTWGNQLWSEKPPLLLWMAAMTAKASGQLMESWPYRLWSCLGAALCVFALMRLGAMAGSWFAGVFAALLFALQGDLIFHARFFTMDTAMLGCVLMAAVCAASERWAKAGLWLAAAMWIKSWFVLAFFPALGFALWRNVPRREGLRAGLWIFGLALLGLAASLLFYAHVYGREFWDHDLKWNLLNRARGLSNEHIESNWSYYGKWASRAAASLIPLALAAPFGLLTQRKRIGEAGGFIPDFAAMLALSWFASLCLVQAQVINYLLPLEAALCLSWALLISRLKGRNSWTLVLLAAAAVVSARHQLSFGQGILISAVGAFFLIFPGSGVGGCSLAWLRSAAHFILLGLLLNSAIRYLRRPDDAYRPLAEILLAHPATVEGEELLYFGPETQTLAFYSRYNIRRLPAPPRKLELKSQAQLIFDGQSYHFVPARHELR